MLPFNIGLPKTHGLILDRCHEPCPSVIPNTDQPRPNTDLQSGQVYPQYLPAQGTTSRLLLPGVCHEGEAKAASPDGSLHQS